MASNVDVKEGNIGVELRRGTPGDLAIGALYLARSPLVAYPRKSWVSRAPLLDRRGAASAAGW